MSHVMCHVSHVTYINIFIYFIFFGQRGEAYRWRVCYQRGLPRLVLIYLDNKDSVVLRLLNEKYIALLHLSQ